MEEEEIRLHAEKHMVDMGYSNYDIISVIRTENTNLWNVTADIDEGKLEMTINDEDGQLIDKKRHLVRVINEVVEFSDSVSVTVEMFFELVGSVYLGGDMIGIHDIELISNTEDKNYLDGFKITIKDYDEEKGKRAMKRANRFTNYLAAITNLPVSHKRPMIKKLSKQGASTSVNYTVDTALAKRQDIDLSNIPDILDSDSEENQRLYHYRKGLESLHNNEFEQAIRWFYLIIEDDCSPESYQYRSLRLLVSHKQVDNPTRVQELKDNFGINTQVCQRVDFNDPDLVNILFDEAKNLQSITKTKIDNLLI